jgi:predicted metal-dependent hydrolase
MTLTIDNLVFSVRRSSRRQTLEITVERDGSLTVAAPAECPDTDIEAFVREKKVWILGKLIEKEQRTRPPVVKEYVTGEGFYYLGKTFRLMLVDAQAVALKLEHGRFKLARELADDGRAQFVRWYTTRARCWLDQRVHRLAARVGVEPRAIHVRDLGYRWGSCSPRARLSFHWRVATLPPSIAEYVLVHELTHLAVHRHGPVFWRRIERVLPDWKASKDWLADHGTDYSL